MKVNETRIEDFLSQNKAQFVIPVYQRNYDWSVAHCQQLLSDIITTGERDDLSAHFIGSVVYIHDDIYTSSNTKELTIIDGQQRLTTLTLIYITLLHVASSQGNEELANEIYETYLINKYASENEKQKLRSTENNHNAIKYLLRNSKDEDFLGYSKIIENYNFFRTKITEETFESVRKGLSKLIFVEISLDREKDNPQRIFESLNSTGLELSQADLIRNYILMGLKREEQDHIYQNYWKIIEELARQEESNTNKVSDFIRDYLTLMNNKIPNKKRVYEDFKSKYPIVNFSELKKSLNSIKSLAKYYNKLLNPKNENDEELRVQLEYIKKLEINVAYPFLIKVYEDYSNGVIERQTFIDILELIQSYVWRRFIVGIPTNSLNNTFMALYDKVDSNKYLESIQSWLLHRKGVQRFPHDREVSESLKFKDVYNIQSKNRTYLFERLENYQNNESVILEGNKCITVEHIFPQTPSEHWAKNLSQEHFDYIQENYLNTIGNLTLSGNNSKLGNKSFLEKRNMENVGYKNSRLWLNKFLANCEYWDKIQIEKRFELLIERFLLVWKMPVVILHKNHHTETNIFDAEAPTHKKLEYAIFLDQKIEVNQVAKLYQVVFSTLFELYPERFFSSDLAQLITLTKKKNEQRLRQAVTINEIYSIEGNLDNSHKFERIKYALKLLELDDELIIKYAS